MPRKPKVPFFTDLVLGNAQRVWVTNPHWQTVVNNHFEIFMNPQSLSKHNECLRLT
jgi:hypothetical protein